MIRRSWPRQLKVYAAIEVLGALACSGGMAVEFIYGAHFGFIMVTGGLLFYSIGVSLWAKLFVRAA